MAERGASLLKRAAAFCTATVGWIAFVGGAAVVTAAATGSPALIWFGVNAVVDSSVSALLAWRFRAEASGRRVSVERTERRALRLAAGAFALIGAYVLVRASLTLAHHNHRSSYSRFGVLEAAGSLVVLPYLASGKYRLSTRLGSRALRADSLLTVSGIALAGIALGGMLAERWFGWWADPLAAIGIGSFLGWQAVGALRDARDTRPTSALVTQQASRR